MIWTVCICISAALFLLSVVCCVYCACVPRLKKRGAAFWVFAAGVALACVAAMYPLNADKLGGYGLKTALLSILQAAELFGIGDYYGYREALIESGAARLTVSLGGAYAAVLFTAAPFITAGVVLSIFKGILVRIRYALGFFSEAYVFSELNEQTLALAKDLKKNDRKRVVVFCCVKEDTPAELVGDARVIGAVCFAGDIVSGSFAFHSKRKELSYFLMGADDADIVKKALFIMERDRNRDNTHLYIFSSTTQSELLLSAHGDGKIKVRRINPQKALVHRWLFENGSDIFKHAKTHASGNVSAVVVGLGGYGTEAVKALVWYCQMDGYTVTVNAFDADKRAEDKFAALCPEIMSEKYNGVRVEGEASYFVRVHSDVDVQTAAFEKDVAAIDGVTHVVVSLGNDELNVRTAVRLRALFERLGTRPVIQAIVYNGKLIEELKGVKNFKNQAYGIDFIGDVESSYSESVIIGGELEKAALACHLKYGEEADFWRYEYNYDSSVATAIHKRARIACGFAWADKKEEELTKEEREQLEVIEHRRWNAYMRSCGYVYSGSKDASSRNDLGKMHHNLVPFDELSEADKRKDGAVGSN